MLGFAVGIALLLYIELGPESSSYLIPVIGIIVCPPALLSVVLLDVKEHSAAVYVVWGIIALLNSAFYMAVGMLVARIREPKEG